MARASDAGPPAPRRYVIKYYDSFIDGDSLNIVMEMAENGDLGSYLKVPRTPLMAALISRP